MIACGIRVGMSREQVIALMGPAGPVEAGRQIPPWPSEIGAVAGEAEIAQCARWTSLVHLTCMRIACHDAGGRMVLVATGST